MTGQRPPLALFHTGEAHVATFTRLIGALDPSIPLVHRVRKDLLDAAQPHGLTPAIRRAGVEAMLALPDDGAALVLCTCSTLGPAAETAALLTGVPVLRVDRPLMEEALRGGRRILVAACLASTLGPTGDLLARTATELGKEPVVRTVVLADAWRHFEAGDLAAYHAAVAAGLRGQAGDAEVIVLAQASMAGAVPLLADLPVPVLASPAIGSAAAVRAWQRAVRPAA